MMSSGATISSWWLVLNFVATWRAYSSSLYFASLNPTEKVLIGNSLWRLISATTAELSMPPDRKEPNGTSATMRSRTASLRVARNAETGSESGVRGAPSPSGGR